MQPVRWLFDLYCARVLRAGRIQRTSQTAYIHENVSNVYKMVHGHQRPDPRVRPCLVSATIMGLSSKMRQPTSNRSPTERRCWANKLPPVKRQPTSNRSPTERRCWATKPPPVKRQSTSKRSPSKRRCLASKLPPGKRQRSVKCPPHSDPGSCPVSQHCGFAAPLPPPVFYSFYLLVTFIIYNLVIAIIMDNFGTGLVLRLGSGGQLEQFRDVWFEFDPQQTGLIRRFDLSGAVQRAAASFLEDTFCFVVSCP